MTARQTIQIMAHECDLEVGIQDETNRYRFRRDGKYIDRFYSSVEAVAFLKGYYAAHGHAYDKGFRLGTAKRVSNKEEE